MTKRLKSRRRRDRPSRERTCPYLPGPPEAELVGICDPDPAKADKAKELGTTYYKDARELLGKVDAVSIATPTSTHYAVAREFLAAGFIPSWKNRSRQSWKRRMS